MILKELKQKPYFIRSRHNKKTGITTYTYSDDFVIKLGKKHLSFDMDVSDNDDLWKAPLWFQKLYKLSEKKSVGTRWNKIYAKAMDQKKIFC